MTNHNVLLFCDTVGRIIGGYLCFEGKHYFHVQDEGVRQVYRNAIRHCGITTRWYNNWRPQELLLVDGGSELCRNIFSGMRHCSNGVMRRDFEQVIVSSILSNFHQDPT